VGNVVESGARPYTLTVDIRPPVDPYVPLTGTVPISFPVPARDETVRTLILFNRSRMNQLYGTGDTITTAHLVTKLLTLVSDPAVAGELVDVDAYPEIVSAYRRWEKQIKNPMAANFVALHIKSLLYRLAPAYPNLEYLVIVGGDRVIPHRRIRDEALIANERHYTDTMNIPNLGKSFHLRYFLTDDYYAGLLPLPFKGRELYLPHLAVGRLVESPAEIAAAVDAFLTHSLLSPANAVVTGYDFLIDQAEAISATLRHQGITDITPLINDSWTDVDFRDGVFTHPTAHSLNSLNSHFKHDLLYPNNASDQVFATEVISTTDYTGVLVFSVGCHSGLNVPDADSDSVQTGTDWAQAFSRQGAVFIGNTGYGYGDSDLIAYSERLMADFVEALGIWHDGAMPTVGHALLEAKHHYYNSAAVSALSNYDEKVLEELTLYGLPMLKVRMPVTHTAWSVDAGGAWHVRGPVEEASAGETYTTTQRLSLAYNRRDVAGLGTYYYLEDSDEVHVMGGSPVQPRISRDIHQSGTIAHGVLWVGGTFSDQPLDPVISRVVTEEVYMDTEPTYPAQGWYPVWPGTINRFLAIDGRSRERLVVVPGQFQAAAEVTPTTGVQRLYSDLEFVIYHAPFTATDFIAPNIRRVEALSTTSALKFWVHVVDSDESVASNTRADVTRVLVLYRFLADVSAAGTSAWIPLDLDYDAANGWAVGQVDPGGPVEYFVQAVDATGNVALAMDHGNPFRKGRVEVAPPSQASIQGLAVGVVHTPYTFTAVVTPSSVAASVVYTWSPGPMRGQGTSAATYRWASPGVETLRVVAANAGGSVSHTHAITVVIPITQVIVQGPVTGTVETVYPFTATLSPPTASSPIAYRWTPEPGGGQGTRAVTYTWSVTGTHTIGVSAENLGSWVTTTHTIIVTSRPPKKSTVYLPLVLKSW
jgi:hypothetical protein